jgi:hypothetical protein
MTSEQASTPSAAAGEERKAQGEEPRDEGIMHRMSRLPLPGAALAGAMPTGMPGRVLWWGGLAALAAFDIVEWPVAIIVGAGEWVAEQYAKAAAQGQRAEQWKTASHEPSHG